MGATDIAIIDSGGANIASLQFALQRLGRDSTTTRDKDDIRRADRVILPGVGAARNAMETLHENDLVDLICDLTQPVLGICLGMQLLCEGSDEEDVDCLGIVPGQVRKLPASSQMPVPNMGWCSVSKSAEHPVLANIDDGAFFYFVHSYALPPGEQTVATASHAIEFSAVIAKDNFVAAQFHPERSSAAGARLLSNFLEWTL
jgi:glutamine amidotransferase